MSNTPKPANGHFSLASYRAEAAKKGDKKGDYVLDVDTAKSISIPRPNGEQLFQVEAATSSEESIRALAGDQADDLIEVFKAEDAAVMRAISEDMQKHFGLGESGASRG